MAATDTTIADGPAGGHTPQLALDGGGGTLFVWQGLDDPHGHAAICARTFRSTPAPSRSSSPGEIAAP